MGKEIRINNKWVLLSLSAAVFSSIVLIIGHGGREAYLCVIPLVYSIVSSIFYHSLSRCKFYKKGILYYCFNVIIYIRYVVTIIGSAIPQEEVIWKGWGPSASDKAFFIAIGLLSGEIIVVFLVQYLTIFTFERKLRKEYTSYRVLRYSSHYEREHVGVLLIFAILGLPVVLIVSPSLIIPTNFFVISDDTSGANLDNTDIPFQGMYVILANAVKVCLFIALLILCKKKYDRKRSLFYKLIAYLDIFLYLAFNTSTNRMTMIFILILGLYFIHSMFDGISLGVILGGGAIVLVSFISASLFKFKYVLGEHPSFEKMMSMFAPQLQDYFAGPKLVGQMIDLKTNGMYTIGFQTFINDFLGSVPFVSNSIDQSNRINEIFCLYNNVKNSTLIAPILGTGYCYFPFFPFVFSVVFTAFVIFFDYRMQTTSKVSYKFVYGRMGFIVALFLAYSVQTIYAEVVSVYIPMIVLLKFNDYIFFKFNKKHSYKGVRISNSRLIKLKEK